jgi:MFS family permease
MTALAHHPGDNPTPTAAAIGSVASGLAAMRLRQRHPLRVAVPIAALACLAPLAFATLLPLPVIAAAGALGGVGLLVFESLWQTSVQRHVPEQMLSRADSYDWFGSLVAYPVGLAIAGPLAATAGPRLVLLAVGILLVVVMGVLLAVPSVWRLADDTSAPVTGEADAPARR